MISRVMKRDFTNMISRVMKRDREATGQDQDVLVNLPRLASNLQEEEYNPYFVSNVRAKGRNNFLFQLFALKSHHVLATD